MLTLIFNDRFSVELSMKRNLLKDFSTFIHRSMISLNLIEILKKRMQIAVQLK